MPDIDPLIPAVPDFIFFAVIALFAIIGLGILALAVTLIVVVVRRSASGAPVRVQARYFDHTGPVTTVMHMSQNTTNPD